MTWYVRVIDSKTNELVYTDTTSDQNDAYNLANTWHSRGEYNIKVYEGE